MTSEEAADIKELALERDAAQRDLEETLEALEEKLSPVPAARRFVEEQSAARALSGMLVAGLAVGLIPDDRPSLQLSGLAAAGVAVRRRDPQPGVPRAGLLRDALAAQRRPRVQRLDPHADHR